MTTTIPISLMTCLYSGIDRYYQWRSDCRFAGILGKRSVLTLPPIQSLREGVARRLNFDQLPLCSGNNHSGLINYAPNPNIMATNTDKLITTIVNFLVSSSNCLLKSIDFLVFIYCTFLFVQKIVIYISYTSLLRCEYCSKKLPVFSLGMNFYPIFTINLIFKFYGNNLLIYITQLLRIVNCSFLRS